MDDLLLWAVMAFVTAGLGLPVSRILPVRFAWRELLAPMFGTAILAVVVPLAYRLGVTMRIQLIAYVIIALVSAVLSLRARPIRFGRSTRYVAGIIVLGSLVLLLPRWTGGDQFAVFRGNQWDSYNYLESAIAFGEKPYAKVDRATQLDELRDPTLVIAKAQLPNRPSVHELYALFSRVAPGRAYRMQYAYLVFFMAQLALVALFALRNAVPHIHPGIACAIAWALPLGFWGQYILDIDAWSQVASASILFAVFALSLRAADELSASEARRLAIAIGFASAGAVYLYPEGLSIYLAATGPVVVVWIALGFLRARRAGAGMQWRRLIPLAGFSGIAAAVLSPDLVRLLLGQLSRGNSAAIDWWTYFQRFFIGRDDVWGSGFDRAADFVASTFGLYFLTPAGDGALATLQRVLILALIAGLVIAVVRMMLARDQPADRATSTAWAATSLLLLAPAAFLASKHSYWAAGKVVSFAAPVFVATLCLPIVRADRWRWFAAAFIAIQLCAGLVRIDAATWNDHIGYAKPYPGIQIPGLKQDIGWDLRRLEPYLDRRSKVTVFPTEPWSLSALICFLTARRIPYVLQNPVPTFPGGPDLGKMPMPWTPHTELSVHGSMIQIDFLDHRWPSVQIPTR
ncbi:MAG: hypothetical protein ABJE66_05220 [Deltaproteobacteria bacterium]